VSTGPEDRHRAAREAMVERQLACRGITDEAVLTAMRNVPRHRFVPAHLQRSAYDDCALPIGPEQTISQPYIVAEMLQELRLEPPDRVLEIGAGTGYQAAVMAEIAAEVFSLEIDSALVKRAQALLAELKYSNIRLACRDGFLGWKEEAPFDKIIVSAAPDSIPRELVKQLVVGGRMILPLGSEVQVLVSLEKKKEGLVSSDLGQVRFVAMKGEEPR
jgi:protein-L-isoaspartate(D-aspartate) O-methyltransferase